MRELFDAGAQAERTALAWQRTGLAAIGVGALLVHAAVSSPHRIPLWPGIVLMMSGALAAAVLAPLRYRSVLHAIQSDRTPVSVLATSAMTLVQLVVALVVAVAVVRV